MYVTSVYKWGHIIQYSNVNRLIRKTHILAPLKTMHGFKIYCIYSFQTCTDHTEQDIIWKTTINL